MPAPLAARGAPGLERVAKTWTTIKSNQRQFRKLPFLELLFMAVDCRSARTQPRKRGLDIGDAAPNLPRRTSGEMPMPSKPADDLLRGTLDALVLKTLSWGPRHGYAIAAWIRETSGDALRVEDRALYLALHRLEDKGWLASDWGVSENNRRAKYYALTPAGRARLRAEASRLTRYAEALFRVLNATA
jgi:PadR family transcriptional regulator PadR